MAVMVQENRQKLEREAIFAKIVPPYLDKT